MPHVSPLPLLTAWSILPTLPGVVSCQTQFGQKTDIFVKEASTPVMDIDAITPEFLKTALLAWQRAHEPPPEILQLDLLRSFDVSSDAERSLRLHDYLQAGVQERLTQQRTAAGLSLADTPPMTTQGVTAVLCQDFGCNNSELETWSALYHHYFVPFPLDEAALAAALPISPRNYRRRVHTGLERLVQLLRRAEMDAHQQYQAEHRRRHLPPPDYLALFGVARQLHSLVELFAPSSPVPFVSIEGLGGIGKTSLARAVAHQLAEQNHWRDILWVSAKQHRLSERGELHPFAAPARTLDDIVNALTDQLGQTQLAGLPVAAKLARLKPFLNSAPHLIIIDNLETVADVDVLLPALQPLAGVTRFLLTSRQSMSRYPFVKSVPVPELSPVDSQALVGSELQRLGQKIIVGKQEVERLYYYIGGLPLALKLTAAQLGHRSLDEVIRQMQKVGKTTPYSLYAFIYRHTWALLNDTARMLLLSVLDIGPDGDNAAWLRRMNPDLPEADFDAALSQLIDFSLVEVGGTLANRVYRLHRLTVTFLQTDILGGWLDDEM